MSISSINTRISEIQSMVAAVQSGLPPSKVSSGTSFSNQLAQASGPGAAGGAGAVAPFQAAPPAGGPAPSAGAGGSVPYASLIDGSAKKYGLDPAVLRGLIKQESDFDIHSGSSAGAQGLTQLMPGTARALGVTNPLDPAQSIDAGAHYLRQQLDTFGGDLRKALAAYNAGPGAVQRYGGIPPYAETQNYVRKVMDYADGYRRSGPSPAASIGRPGTIA